MTAVDTMGPGEVKYRIAQLIKEMILAADSDRQQDRLHQTVGEVADAFIKTDDKNRHIKAASRLVGAANSDVFIQRLNRRIMAQADLQHHLAKVRTQPAPSTVTEFTAPALSAKDLLKTENLANLAALLRVPVTIGHDLNASERNALRQAIAAIADFGQRSTPGLSDVPEAIRDHVKDLLLDSVQNAAEFTIAIEKIGAVHSAKDAQLLRPREVIARFEKLKTSGGNLNTLPAAHGIRTKAWELLTRSGGKITMEKGTPLYVPPKKKPVPDANAR